MGQPLRHARVDGWTVARQIAFLVELRRTGTVTAAAAAAGLSCTSAYRLRKQPTGKVFARAWQLALADHADTVAFHARRPRPAHIADRAVTRALTRLAPGTRGPKAGLTS